MPMNQDVKATWTAALRSDRFKQGRQSLRKRLRDGTEEHCCLGVLCDLAVEAGVLPEPTLTSGRVNDGSQDYEYQSNGENGEFLWPEAGVLPYNVRKWAGLEMSNPEVIIDGYGRMSLAMANDNGNDFNTIADVIDAQL